MPMDEVIRAIEQTDAENMQDVMRAAIDRYRELYPDWKIIFVSADTNATDGRSRELLELISKADEIFTKNANSNLNEK